MTADSMLKYTGCIHAKGPDITPAVNLCVNILDIICEHRVLPHMKMALHLTPAQKLLHAGLPGRLLDYYPRVEFIVWRKDHCPENDPITKFDRELEERFERDEKEKRIARRLAVSTFFNMPELLTVVMLSESCSLYGAQR